jgi:hypothetical protein
VISFDMPALSAIEDIQVDINMAHTWVGDLNATLRAPDGDSHILFSDTGSTTATACGDSSNMGGTYVFSDVLPTPKNWWTAAQDTTGAAVIPVGNYRTTSAGDVPEGGQDTVILDSFDDFYAPGTWELALSDGGGGDTGSVSSAQLTVEHLGCSPAPCLATLPHNNGQQGIFFDITAKDQAITITGLDFTPSGNDGAFQILYKNGTYVGFDQSLGPWKTDQPIRNITGIDGTTQKFYAVNNISIKPNQTKGFLLGADTTVASRAVQYRGPTGFRGEYENEHIRLFSDLAASGTDNVASILEGSGRFTPRAFAGTIYYNIDDSACYVTIAANGNTITFCL